MTKRIISLILAAVLILTLLPTNVVRAGDASSVTLTYTDGSQQIITEDTSGANWSYVKDTNTLTLSGWSGSMISANGDLKLVLEGTNTITMAEDASYSYGIYVSSNSLNIYGSSASDKLVINGDLASKATAIRGQIYAYDYANIDINLKTTDNVASCYGIDGNLFLCGSNSVVNVDVTSSSNVYAINYMDARSSRGCGSGNVITSKATSTGIARAFAFSTLYVNNTNPVITATATNAGDSTGKLWAVNTIQSLKFTKGGKLTANGLLGYSHTSNMPDGLDGGILTSTTPANNEYIWVYRNYYNSRKKIVANADGTDCLNPVFVGGDADVPLKKVPGSTFTLPEGKVGEGLSQYGSNYTLTDVVRGIKGYLSSNIRFEVTSGTLPEGITLNQYYGSFSGTFASTCEAGTVTVQVKNLTTNETVSFDVNYGKVVEADHYININGKAVEMKTNDSGTGWTYDGSTKTLTLENYYGGPIKAERGFNLHLKEGNTITIPDEDDAYGLAAYETYFSSSYDINITAKSSTSSLSISSSNRTKSFRGIIAKNLYLKDNVSLYMTVTGTTSSSSYGCYGSIYYAGSNVNLQMSLETKGQLYGAYYLRASESENAGSDCYGNINVKTNSSLEAEAIQTLYIYKASPNLTLKAVSTGDSTKAFAVYNLSYLALANGGKIDATGLFTRPNSSVFKYTNRNVVTTTPSGDKYIWDKKTVNGGVRDAICTVDGQLCEHTVFTYSAQKAKLQWVGNTICKIPEGIVGSAVSSYYNGYAYDLRRFIRGLEDYDGNGTSFEIIEGSLPAGLTLQSRDGGIVGTFTSPCLAGSVKVRAKNTATNESIDFIVKYGKVVSNAPVTALNLSDDAITVGKDGTTTFTASVTPADAAYATVTAASSDSSTVEVLSVGQPNNGSSIITLKGKREGTATITVTSIDSGLKKSLQVTVAKKTPAAEIDFSDEKLTNVLAGEVYLISVGDATAEEFTADSGRRIAIKEDWFGKTIKIVLKGASASENSSPQSLVIPTKPVAPSTVTMTKAANKNSATGKLSFPSNCQYRKVGASSWLTPVDNEAGGLYAGSYEYRKAASLTSFASEKATIEVTYAELAIEQNSALKITKAVIGQSISTIKLADYVSGGSGVYKYSIVSGPSWLKINETSGEVSGKPDAVAAATTAKIKVVDEDLSEVTATISVCAVICASHNYKTTITAATPTADGKIVKTCTLCGDSTTTVICRPDSYTLSAEKFIYDGKEKTPTITVKDRAGKALVNNTDYTITYSEGRKNVGAYTATIKFKGNYSGEKKLGFTIVPKATSISKLSALKAGFKIVIKKQAKETNGYQLQYSTTSTFKTAKLITISKNSTTSKKVSKLAKGKKYYVRVRTYKKVGNVSYYSEWSKAKTVKTKK